MLSLLLADLPGLPMANRGNAALTAIPVMAVIRGSWFHPISLPGLACDDGNVADL